jgi:hypothetical protein
VTVHFSGTFIIWNGKVGPNYGQAAYSIDGWPQAIVDNYNSFEIDQNPNVSVYGLNPGPHSLTITVLPQTSGSDYWQTIDSFTSDGGFLTFDQADTAGYNWPSGLVFSGNWGSGAPSDGSDLSGGHWWSREAGDSISWTFAGRSLVEVYGRPDYENGYMNVFVDGNYAATVDLLLGDIDDDAVGSCLLVALPVSTDQHTITVQVAGYNDGSARDNFVQPDMFAAF